MSPLFRRTRTQPIPPADEQRWGVARGETDSGPLIVRHNETAAGFVGHPDLPVRVGFAIPLNEPQHGGLPTPDEAEAIASIEDLIVARALSSIGGIHVLTLTTGVMRELIFYTAEGRDIAGVHQEIRERVPSHEVQCLAERDPGWDSYLTFLS